MYIYILTILSNYELYMFYATIQKYTFLNKYKKIKFTF